MVEHIGLACRRRGWPAPTWRTVKSRLLLIDQRVQAVRRGDATAARAMNATPGEYPASRPLEVVQIDHTQVDVIVVDEQSREEIGRPWITLAVDVLTRMVTGFNLSLDAPSRVSIGLCLLHAVYDKMSWTAERGIDAPWPVAGLARDVARGQRGGFPQPSLCAGVPQSEHPDPLAPSREAPFWRAH